jgi:drug/metabolite transporter (DMT)-like permease
MHRAGPKSFSTPSPSVVGLAALVTANVALAFGPWFVRLADTGPVAAGFWRLALAAPVLAAVAGPGVPRLERSLWLTLALGGLCFAADLASWHIGILHTTLANATLFGNCATLIFPVYGFLVARRWPSRTQAFALALAAAGAGLLMGKSYQLDARNLVGDLLCLLAGVLYTAYFICVARARATLSPGVTLLLSTLAGIVPLLVFAWAMGERVWPGDWAPLLGLALASQLVGQGCMTYALGRLSPLVVGLALLIQPVVAGLIGWSRYGERPGAAELAGMVLVAIALVLVRRGGPVAERERVPDMAAKETA